MVVHPFTCFLSAVFTAQTFHPLYKTIQLGGYLLESPFFKADDFHCLHHFQLNIYIQNSGKGQVFTANMPSCIIVLFSAGNMTVLSLFPTANKASRNHTAINFQTGDDALPGMTSCYISSAYNELFYKQNLLEQSGMEKSLRQITAGSTDRPIGIVHEIT